MKRIMIIWIIAIGMLMAGIIFGTMLNQSIIYWLSMIGLVIAWAITEKSIHDDGRDDDQSRPNQQA